jgi:hypothetical protein
LADRDHTQRDLAIAWEVDDAVVSRFTGTGKPIATAERIRVLAQMLHINSDEPIALARRKNYHLDLKYPKLARKIVVAAERC